MSGLFFHVGADFDKLNRLQRDIQRLKGDLLSMDQAANPKAFKALEKQLQQLTAEFNREAEAAAKAGAMTARSGQAAKEATSDFDKLAGGIKKVGAAAGITLAVDQILQLGKEIINVRAEIEALEKSFTVLLGSKEQADTLIDSMKAITLKSNFSLTDLSGAAQTLLGFGIEAEKVIPTIEQLGNISMGNRDRFNSLALAFAQMSATGKLMGQDLLQMINAGFNPLQEIARKTGKSIMQLKDEMSDPSIGISSQVVADAFQSIASEGGKFYGMMESQTDAIKGSQAKLSGEIQTQMNAFGEANVEMIKGGYNLATSLVQNYQVIGESLTALIATYGLYKTAVMVDTALKPIIIGKQYEAQAAALSKLLSGEQAYRISQLGLVQGSAEHVAAIKAEIAARAESTQSKLAEEQINLQMLRTKRAEAEQTWILAKAKTQAAREELASAMITAQGEAEASLQKKMSLESEKQSRVALRIVKLQEQKDVAIAQATALKEKGLSEQRIASKNREIASIQNKINAARQEEIQHGRNVAAARLELRQGVQNVTNKNVQTLTNRVNTLSEQENAAAVTHNGYIRQMVGSKILVRKLATDADTASTLINTAATTAQTTATGYLAAAQTKLWAISKNLFSVLVPNPYVLGAAAVIGLVYGIYKLTTASTVQEQVQKSLNSSLDEAKKKKDDLSTKTDDLTSTVNSETKTIFDQISAYKQLQGLYPSLLKNMDIHEFKALGVTEQQKLLNAALNDFDFVNQEAKLIELNKLYDQYLSAQQSGNGYSIGSAATDIANALDISFWDKYSKSSNQIFEILKQTIAGLEKEKNLRQENLKEAEFQAKPEAEKKKLLQEQLEVLKQQENALTESILLTGEYKRNIDGTISPASELGKKFTDVTDLLKEWNTNPFAVSTVFSNANPAIAILISQLRELNNEKQKVLGQITADVVPIINKASLEKQVKEFNNLKESIAPDLLKKLQTGKSITPSILNTSPEEFNRLSELEKKYKTLAEVAKDAKGDLKVYEDPEKAEKAAESAAKKAETAAAKAIKKAQDEADLKLKIENDAKKALLEARSTQLENEQKLLETQEDSFSKQQQQLELNHQKELLSIEKRSQELILKKQEAERKKWDLDNPNGAKTPFTPKTSNIDDLDLSDQADLAVTTIIASKTHEKATSDLLKSLLEKYQDFNAKRLSLEKKYKEDVAVLNSQRTDDNAIKTDAAIKEAGKQLKKSLSNLNLEEFQESIDWSSIFGNLDKISTDALVEVRDKIKTYLSEIGDGINKEDLKTVSDAFVNLNNAIADRRPIGELKDAYKEYRDALDEVIEAKKELKKYEDGTPEYVAATKALSEAEKKRRESLVKMNTSINEIGEKGGQLVNSGKEIIEMLSNFGIEVNESVQTALNGVGQVMSGLEKIDLTKPFSIVTGGISVLAGFGNMIAGLLGQGGNELSQETFDRYEALMSVMDKVIAKQTELLNSMAGKEAVEASKIAIQNIEKQIEATKKLGTDYLNSGDSWKSHSHIYELRKSLRPFQKELKELGYNLDGSASAIFELTPEQLYTIQKEIPEAWANIDDKTREYLQTVIDSKKELEDVKEKLNEVLTGITFDSAKDSLKSLLLDSDTTMADIADNFENYMRDAIMNIVVDGIMSKRLKDWYENFALAMDDDVLSESEKKDLQAEYIAIYEKAKEERDALLDLANIDLKSSSQSASKGDYETMSQDTGTAIEGRATAIQMSVLNIEGYVAAIAGKKMETNFNMPALTPSNDTRNIMVKTYEISDAVNRQTMIQEESRTIQLNSYYALRNIEKSVNELYPMHEKLGRIENSLSQL